MNHPYSASVETGILAEPQRVCWRLSSEVRRGLGSCVSVCLRWCKVCVLVSTAGQRQCQRLQEAHKVLEKQSGLTAIPLRTVLLCCTYRHSTTHMLSYIRNLCQTNAIALPCIPCNFAVNKGALAETTTWPTLAMVQNRVPEVRAQGCY